MNERLIEEEVLFALIQEQLDEGRKASFIVTGMSMWPFICHGRDSVVIEKSENLNKYDIILYQTFTGKYILHRLTAIDGDKIITTGDGNTYRDPVIFKNQVIAKVVSHTYKGKVIEESNREYQVLVKIWSFLFPIRSGLLTLLRSISKIKSFLRITR